MIAPQPSYRVTGLPAAKVGVARLLQQIWRVLSVPVALSFRSGSRVVFSDCFYGIGPHEDFLALTC